MTAEEKPAIIFDSVTKRYRLGERAIVKLLNAFGLPRFVGETNPADEFLALDGVSFRIKRGQRLGLIGRNGAGKTTLLKLISGNYRPTAGRVEINGSVQALMTMGQGFHPDYTGRENIYASLEYNGLARAEIAEAFQAVVEFCELGPFLEQPFKTYSSGMQARLMFATATAIRPDILVIDEVLGAGDAYFLAKSKQRVDQIIANGCTLLLVSHLMQQVLELCDEVMWLEGGRINLFGEAHRVVKEYEKAMYEASKGSGNPAAARRRQVHARLAPSSADSGHASELDSDSSESCLLSRDVGQEGNWLGSQPSDTFQIPNFAPDTEWLEPAAIPDQDGRIFRNEARDGLSRWEENKGIKVVGFTISGPSGPTNRLMSLEPAKMSIFLESEIQGKVAYTYGVAIYDFQGHPLCRFFSPPDQFDADVGTGRRVELLLNPNRLGPGTYVISLSVHEATTVEGAHLAPRYDLLNRSFEIAVEVPSRLINASAQFFHAAEWTFDSAEIRGLTQQSQVDRQSTR